MSKKKGTKNPTTEETAKLDKAVAFLRKQAHGLLKLIAMKVGKYVIDNFFGGDPEAAQSHNPKKAASFRKLCKRDDLPIPETTLRRMVSIYLQGLFLEENGIDASEESPLSYSLLAELVVMKENDDKSKEAKLTVVNEALETLKKGPLTAVQLRQMVSTKLKEGKTEPDQGEAVIRIPRDTLDSLEAKFEHLKAFDLNTKADFLKLEPAKRSEAKKTVDETIQELLAALKLYRKLAQSIASVATVEAPTEVVPSAAKKRKKKAA